MEGVRFPGPSGRQLLAANNLKARLPPGDLIQDGRSEIGRAVIQNDQLEIWPGLGQQGLDAAADVTLFIASRHQD